MAPLFSIGQLFKINQKFNGFTLLELVIVIVVMGIMAISLGSLTRSSVVSYIDAKDRNSQSQTGKWVAERIGREVRDALPQSIRTADNGITFCIEFMPISNGSTALDIPSSGGFDQFNAVGFDLAGASAPWLAIMPLNTADIYLGNAGSSIKSGYSAAASGTPIGSEVQITFPTEVTYAQRSPRNRFFLAENPVSFCLNNATGELYRYSGYGMSAGQSTPPGGGAILARDLRIDGGGIFTFQAGTLSRAGLLQIHFIIQNRNRNFSGSQESIGIFHEVHINNVP